MKKRRRREVERQDKKEKRTRYLIVILPISFSDCVAKPHKKMMQSMQESENVPASLGVKNLFFDTQTNALRSELTWAYDRLLLSVINQ